MEGIPPAVAADLVRFRPLSNLDIARIPGEG